jgi:hypothetical protein
VGKFLIGAYTYGKYKDYKHSNDAFDIVRNMAFAKFGFLGYSNPISENDFKGWSLVKQIPVTPHVNAVYFKSDNLRIDITANMLENFGRHFSVYSPKKNMTRYYTICNALREEMYLAHASVLEGKDSRGSIN